MLLDFDRHRIKHMVDAARQATSFIEGRQRADLDTDAQQRLALLHALEVADEAANHVTPETCVAHPEIPWHPPRRSGRVPALPYPPGGHRQA